MSDSAPNPSLNLTHRSTIVYSAVFAGFSAGVAVWVTWFLTHIPWIGIAESTSLPIILIVWLIGATLSIRISGLRGGQAAIAGTIAGLITGLICLLILGSKLAKAPDASGTSAGLVPSAGLIVIGFVVLAVVIGAVGGVFGGALAKSNDRFERSRWLARQAVLTCVAVAPLLFIGGLVTSTNSGMAVPDYPNTYGTNMFLYPLGPRIDASSVDAGGGYEKIFFEHSHRLFGTLVGLCTLTLLVMTFIIERRRWVQVLASICFALVCLQGLLGGLRVLKGSAELAKDSRWYAIGHGVLAQLLFGLLIGLAVVLSPTFRSLTAKSIERLSAKPVRRFKMFATAALHTLILQLLLGAMYRHLRHDHVLYTHAAFATIVMIVVLLAGITAIGMISKDEPDDARLGGILRRFGVGVVLVVTLQFVFGWIAFFVGGRGIEALSIAQALLRTAHQANGAVLLALAAGMYVWALRMKRLAAG